MPTSFHYLSVSSGLVNNKATLERILEPYQAVLDALGGKNGSDTALSSPLPLVYFVVTGGSEQKLMQLQAEREKTCPNEAILLLAHPTHNSLPAALELLARFQQEGKRGRIVYLADPKDDLQKAELAEALEDLQVAQYLQQARIGLVGDPSDWLVASSPAAATVKASWGAELVTIDIEAVEQAITLVSDELAKPHKRSLFGEASGLQEPSDEQLNMAVKTYIALKEVVGEFQLDALTVRCFDIVKHLHTTGCFALAQLTDEGVIAGCEGDVVSTLGLLWAHKLLGEIPWMANPAQLNAAENRMWLAHCTVPRSLVKSYALRSHFESGLGVGLQGVLPSGPVTLLRLGGKDLKQIWLAEGQLLEPGNSEHLCRTQAHIALERGGTVRDLLTRPLGNHTIMLPGQHMNRLQSWWESMI